MDEHDLWDENGSYIWSAQVERNWATFAHSRIRTIPVLLIFFAGGFNRKPPKTQRLINIAKLMYRAERELEAFLAETSES